MSRATRTTPRRLDVPRVGVILVVLLGFGAPVAAKPTPAQKCTSAKGKAAAKAVAATLVCHARAAGKGTPVDAACVAKAEGTFVSAFGAAEARGGCPTAGDAGAVQAHVDQLVQQAVGTLPGGSTREAGRCAAAKRKAAGKNASATLRCHAKAIVKGTAVDGACLGKADGAFARTFVRAEAKSGCAAVDDADQVAAQVDAFVDGVLAVLVPTTTPTTTTSTTTVPTPVSFAADVQPIFSANCAFPGCHAAPVPMANMNLSAGLAYGNVVNVASFEVPTLVRVLPGDPANSYLYMKITNAPGIQGVPMPFGAFPLPAAQIATIGNWITQGARND
jgi:hypothetical protein